MGFRSFLIQLGIIAVVLSAIQFALCSSLPELIPYQNLFWISQVFFIILSLISFIGGKHFVKKPNKNAFFQFMMLLIFARLVTSATLVIGYFQMTKPTDKLFLLPFFIAYLSYTIFEVAFLSKIGREN
jgi:hypothetical protein